MRASWETRRVARLMLAVMLAAVGGVGIPTGAGATTTGGGVLNMTFTWPLFPCNSPCPASASGNAALSLSGLGTTTIGGVPLPYTAEWTPTASSLSLGSADYQDTCELGQEKLNGTVPLSGSGSGNFSLSGGTAVVGAGVVSGATLSGNVQIDRVGNEMRLVMTGLVIKPPSGSPVLAMNTTDLIFGQSATGVVWTNGPGTCPIVAANQVSNQTAQVTGLVVQAV